MKAVKYAKNKEIVTSTEIVMMEIKYWLIIC